MRKIIVLITIFLLIPVITYPGDPKDKKEVENNDGDGKVINIAPIVNVISEDELDKFYKIILSEVMAVAPREDIDDQSLLTLESGKRYDNALCLYMNLPEYEIAGSLLQRMVPILEGEIKKALNDLPGIKGSFKDIKIEIAEVRSDDINKSELGYYVSVEVENPKFDREDLHIDIEKIVWKAKLPKNLITLISSSSDISKDVALSSQIHIDSQTLEFINPLIIVDGLKIPLQNEVKPGKPTENYGELELHVSSSSDVRTIDYAISKMKVELPMENKGPNIKSGVEIVENGTVECSIDCDRLEKFNEKKKNEIIQSFNKLGNIIWDKLTSIVNDVLAKKSREINTQLWCIPIRYKNPVYDKLHSVGIAMHEPVGVNSGIFKVTAEVISSRCDQAQLQQYAGELLQQHGTIEEATKYLKTTDGRESTREFAKQEELYSYLYSGSKRKDEIRKETEEKLAEMDEKFYNSIYLPTSEEDEIRKHIAADKDDELRDHHKYDRAENEDDIYDKKIMEKNVDDYNDRIVNRTLNALRFYDQVDEGKKKEYYQNLTSDEQQIIAVDYYRAIINYLTKSLIYSENSAVEERLKNIPDGLKAYALERLQYLRLHKSELIADDLLTSNNRAIPPYEARKIERSAKVKMRGNENQIYTENEQRAYLDEIVSQIVGEEKSEMPNAAGEVLRVFPEDAPRLLSKQFASLKTDEEKKQFYQSLGPIKQGWLMEKYYQPEIKDRTLDMVMQGRDRIDSFVETLPENLRDSTERRYKNLKQYKELLFENQISFGEHDRSAIDTMRDYHLDAVLELDMDMANLILKDVAPELGQNYIYILPGYDPIMNRSNKVIIAASKEKNIRDILKFKEVHYGFPLSLEISNSGRLIPTIAKDSDGDPEAYGFSSFLPTNKVHDGVVEELSRFVIPYKDDDFVFKMNQPRDLIPKHREVYVDGVDSKGNGYFSLEARPTKLFDHFLTSTDGIFAGILKKVDVSKNVKPKMFIVKDGKIIVGYVYEKASK